jgi:DNA repair photolyase
MAKQKNMYELSAKQFNPFAGCKHNCSYCGSSFQAQPEIVKLNETVLFFN